MLFLARLWEQPVSSLLMKAGTRHVLSDGKLVCREVTDKCISDPAMPILQNVAYRTNQASTNLANETSFVKTNEYKQPTHLSVREPMHSSVSITVKEYYSYKREDALYALIQKVPNLTTYTGKQKSLLKCKTVWITEH